MNDKTQSEAQQRHEQTYFRGATPIFACRRDPRFSYALYVPLRFDQLDRGRTTVLVAMHGTGRMQSLYRDLFAEFAEQHNCIVLAPLFPVGVLGDDNMSGYKYIAEQDIRYDLILMAMLEEVEKRFRVSAARVLMFGFSGGAHFTHRFAVLHPRRILAASVGAPGSVTQLDETRPWWVGVADCEQRFGVTIDFSNYVGLKMHFVVGDADEETWEISFKEGDRNYMPGANDAGRTRGERIRALAESFRNRGAQVRLDIVPGRHEVRCVVPKTCEFFEEVLLGSR